MGETPIPPEPPTPETQPQLIQPAKRKGSRRIIATVLIIIVLAAMLGGLAYMYINLTNRFNKLQSDYDTLQTSHNQLQTEHSQLTTAYETLSEEHSALTSQYTTLNNQYTTLNDQHTTLTNQYSALNDQYSALSDEFASLFQDYNQLSQAFNDPLSYEMTPTTSQLDEWLASDNTDALTYTLPNFICGDFALMLSQHAKLQDWDIGIVAVAGYTETYESYSHAFNAVITSEGLVYVEPQNDHYWWYSGHESIYEGLWWEIDTEWVYVQRFSIVVSYD